MSDWQYIPAHERNTAHNDGSLSMHEWLLEERSKLLDSHMAADALLERYCYELAESLDVDLRGMGLLPHTPGAWNAIGGRVRELRDAVDTPPWREYRQRLGVDGVLDWAEQSAENRGPS